MLLAGVVLPCWSWQSTFVADGCRIRGVATIGACFDCHYAIEIGVSAALFRMVSIAKLLGKVSDGASNFTSGRPVQNCFKEVCNGGHC